MVYVHKENSSQSDLILVQLSNKILSDSETLGSSLQNGLSTCTSANSKYIYTCMYMYICKCTQRHVLEVALEQDRFCQRLNVCYSYNIIGLPKCSESK